MHIHITFMTYKHYIPIACQYFPLHVLCLWHSFYLYFSCISVSIFCIFHIHSITDCFMSLTYFFYLYFYCIPVSILYIFFASFLYFHVHILCMCHIILYLVYFHITCLILSCTFIYILILFIYSTFVCFNPILFMYYTFICLLPVLVLFIFQFYVLLHSMYYYIYHFLSCTYIMSPFM